jgi:hypothetical protein
MASCQTTDLAPTASQAKAAWNPQHLAEYGTALDG